MDKLNLFLKKDFSDSYHNRFLKKTCEPKRKISTIGRSCINISDLNGNVCFVSC